MPTTSKVDHIKDTLIGVLNIYDQVAKILEDSRISAVEWPVLAMTLTTVPGLVNSGRLAMQEFKHLDGQIAMDLVNEIGESFDIKDDALEDTIESILFYLARAYAWVLEGIDLIQDIRVDFTRDVIGPEPAVA